MAYDMPPEIEELELQLQTEPDSQELHEQLLWKYFEDENLREHPRRIESICWYVPRFPRTYLCRSPVVLIDPAFSPEGFRAVETEWLQLLSDNPYDAEVARGAANFFCVSNRSRSMEILRRIIDVDPNQGEVWTDLGRYSADPIERLVFFQEARRRGSTQSNLLVWIGRTAIDAGEFATAEAAGCELLALVDSTRAEYGDKLDWQEKSNAIWARAFDATGEREAATRLVRAISDQAYHKHWGHTVLGYVALHRDDVKAALDHLQESGKVVSDPRLSSYGPSLTLAKELCLRGEWSGVAEYLRACESFWEDERLPLWRNMVEDRKLPDFQES